MGYTGSMDVIRIVCWKYVYVSSICESRNQALSIFDRLISDRIFTFFGPIGGKYRGSTSPPIPKKIYYLIDIESIHI